ncbi:MAG: Hsp20/alpha crystallin family protein [Methanosarcinales archaeon]|nr:Hsp20/alpha crystallin family protein [Methanosarcinales archaeon]
MRRGLVKWDPFGLSRIEPFERTHDILDRMIEGFEPFSGLSAGLNFDTVTPLIDLVEKDNELVATVDLPGMDKKDIELSVLNNVLEVRAERGLTTDIAEEGYLFHERTYNKFYRSVRLPVGVDESNVNAAYKDGTLTIKLPKSELETKKRIEIE